MKSSETRKRPFGVSDHETGDGVPSGSSKRVSLSPPRSEAALAVSASSSSVDANAALSISNACHYDDNDDQEVEFLFSLPPESESQESMKRSSRTDSASDRSELAATLNATVQTDLQSKSLIRSQTPLTDSRNVTPSAANCPTLFHSASRKAPRFSHRSSAYLQSLSEICHAILWDVRWRVGGEISEPLFAWEQGEDLSAVHYLARRYLLDSEEICSGDTSPVSEDKGDPVGKDVAGTSDHTRDAQESEEKLDRCLETYCRLYFRKGPWFRLDNVYTSYYLPRKMERETAAESDPSEDVPHNSPSKPTSPSKFFLPTSQRSKSRSGSSFKPYVKRVENYIDQEFINCQMDAVISLLDDVRSLSRMGLIRFFQSEEECGKTVGNTEKYQTSSSLLRQDEQRTLLAMLGGQKRKRPSPTSVNFPGGTSRVFDLKNNKQAICDTSKNLIWNQMCRQQAIFQSFIRRSDSSSVPSTQFLPVATHVHRILIEQWAMGIVMKASKVEYVPSSILRHVTKAVCEKLAEWTANCDFGGPVLTVMCFRLREAPVQTLRRVCRLYLCATSGPGDMRGDGSNAWRSLPDKYPNKDLRNVPMRTNNVPPPGSNSWHMVSYPGKDWRMRLTACNFIRVHTPLSVETSKRINYRRVQVFSSVGEFHSWETGVELRANGDYLLELNDLVLYTKRKQAREALSENANGVLRQNEDGGAEVSGSCSDDERVSDEASEIDFLELLTKAGRKNVIQQLLTGEKTNQSVVMENIEKDVCILLGTPMAEISHALPVGVSSSDTATSPHRCRLNNGCEKILGVTVILLVHILESRHATATPVEVSSISQRPWLRHMCWEGCMGYLLWDMIPILERRGYYSLAIDALEVLLFGKRLPKNVNLVPESLEFKNDEYSQFLLARCYLSRRARGKAYERLIIDYTHVLRTTLTSLDTDGKARATGNKISKSSRKKAPHRTTANEIVFGLTETLLQSEATKTGRITFAATRTLARRLKRPLSRTLHGFRMYELQELGHRLSNDSDSEEDPVKYSDWTPVTDTAVANAMVTDKNSVGGRCSFVGFEDDELNSVYATSLNVEELAMEYYHQGRLPEQLSPAGDSSTAKGGWVGYHDEGARIRALFRILSSATLGMDWTSRDSKTFFSSDFATIHLTPYQGAPFDLHVGSEMSNEENTGFYQRRKPLVDSFLNKLSNLDAGGICDLVYDSINGRLNYARSTNHFDPSLERDILQVRTVSMLAAGFGGKMLSAIFRCLFFDYRHYSGGLPDLLLFRALYSSGELVDLGEWVGETFSREYQAALKAQQAAQILADRDDEFLGCSKVGDSGARTSNRFYPPSRKSNGHENEIACEDGRKPLNMPERLQLEHNGQDVQVECMCVEVKSQNDRLDPRQEDWLNVLSKYGNARVCKFGKPKNPKAKAGTKEKKPKEVNLPQSKEI